MFSIGGAASILGLVFFVVVSVYGSTSSYSRRSFKCSLLLLLVRRCFGSRRSLLVLRLLVRRIKLCSLGCLLWSLVFGVSRCEVCWVYPLPAIPLPLGRVFGVPLVGLRDVCVWGVVAAAVVELVVAVWGSCSATFVRR